MKQDIPVLRVLSTLLFAVMRTQSSSRTRLGKAQNWLPVASKSVWGTK